MTFDKETYNLGSFLVSEFFSVVKESEPSFKSYRSPLDLIESLQKKKAFKFDSKQLKVTRFVALSLELYNCANRFSETFRLNSQKIWVNPYTKLFLSSQFKKEDFDSFIKNYTQEIVFTAHPTEVFPLSTLKSLNRIEMVLEKYYTAKASERKHRYLQALRANLTNLWLTDEIYRQKPSPEEEADRLFYVFESSLWKATPYFFRKYYWEYNKRYGTSPKHYPNLKFSSWIGGDRDGNPFVTTESTEKIITKSRRKILRLILLELYPLREEILIRSEQKDLLKKYPNSPFPYKALFQKLVDVIQRHLKESKTHNVLSLQKEIQTELQLAYTCLCKDGAKRIANRRLRSLMDRIQTFSLSPLKLDLRQDSEVHSQIVKEIQSLIGSKQIDPAKARKIPFEKLSPTGQDFFKTLKLVKDFLPNPINCYIISMTRSVEDIENLSLLMKIAGVELPMVPLFETPEDIRKAKKIIQDCKKKGFPLKQVMWGYSDSTKKGGRLASAWNLYKSQRDVIKLDPELVHFHGRGGSIARGGGEIESTFGLKPPKLVGSHFRQTFQGEVIQDDFGLPVRAVQSLETLLKEAALNALKPFEKNSPKIEKEIDMLSNQSESDFKKLFYKNNSFSKAFITKSPISIINEMNLGSRPAKRKSKMTGTSYRAIPWVFAWSQTRGSLPIWYGLFNKEDQLLELRKKSTFVAYFLKSISDGLARVDVPIFKKYFDEPDFKKIFKEASTLQKKLGDTFLKDPQQEAFVNYLHSLQIYLLGHKDSPKRSKEISKMCTQGIASYLGKSG